MSLIDKAKELLGVAPVTVGALDEAATMRAHRPAPERTVAPDSSIDIPETYERVDKLLRTGCPLIFVSGNAGTGKTTLIRYLSKHSPLRNVIVAPTGVAALNVGGVTVHSFFRFPPRIQDPDEIKRLSDRTLIRRLELLIVDEISMLRCDLLDNIDVFLRKNRGVEAPFGGVQLLFVGDLFQLPPVVPRQEREILEQRDYASPYFFSAFSLRDLPLIHVELDQPYRQTDPTVVGLLNKVRVAEDVEWAIDEINRVCLQSRDSDHELTLTCTNKQADEINLTSMEALRSPEYMFQGEIEGEFRLEEEKLPSPLDLRLKVGARVMFTKNDELRRWVNGTSGVVRKLSNDAVRVQTGGRSGPTHDVEPAIWETYKYVLDKHGHIAAHQIGEYRQYPLMLAWAVTIHKSQGKTLDTVFVDFGSGAFAAGQAYVALSRCRSLDTVRLARPLQIADVKCDPIIRRFYDALTDATN